MLLIVLQSEVPPVVANLASTFSVKGRSAVMCARPPLRQPSGHGQRLTDDLKTTDLSVAQ